MASKDTILVVEDDPINLDSITDSLEDGDFDYLTAINGREALEILETTIKEIKVIILDWMMPVMGGIELLGILRNDPRYKDIPVIMQTAKTDDQSLVGAFNIGVDQYLKKPFSEDVLLSRTRSAIRSYEKMKTVREQADREVTEIQKSAEAVIKLEKNKVSLDLQTYQVINTFFLDSLKSANYTELTECLLNAIKQFSFPSARAETEPEENARLRCSVRLSGGEEINLSDRGLSCSLDQMILANATDKAEIVQQGSYTAVPSESGNTAILIRNSPKEHIERDKAIQIVSDLLEQFEARLIHFETEQDIINKNNELREKQELLEKQNDQIRTVVKSCHSELDNINSTYLNMKERQMQILENVPVKIAERMRGSSERQIKVVNQALEEEMLASMELYSRDQITDQQFQLTIMKLQELFSEKNEEKDKLTPGQMGGVSQNAVDDLLASLGM